MAKVIRLKGEEQRRWHSHASVIVRENGKELRRTTPREVDVMFQLEKFVRERRQSARAKVPGESSTIEARLETLPGSTAQEARFYVNGDRVEDVREVMAREFLAAHGECQLRTTNGKFLAMVRDPKVVRSTPQDAQRTSPKPDNCICRDWGTPHPGKHHAICEHNQRAPSDERIDGAIRKEDFEVITPERVDGLQATGSDPVAREPVAHEPVIVPRSKDVLPEPDKCVCKDFQRPEGAPASGHHPLCEWHDEWEARGRPEEFLTDVATGEKVRKATLEELRLADENEKATGSRMVTISEKSYAVVPAEA